MRPDDSDWAQPQQDDPDYVPPEPTYDVNEIPREELDLDVYVDADLEGEEKEP